MSLCLLRRYTSMHVSRVLLKRRSFARCRDHDTHLSFWWENWSRNAVEMSCCDTILISPLGRKAYTSISLRSSILCSFVHLFTCHHVFLLSQVRHL
jgi:hypothetical protein